MATMSKAGSSHANYPIPKLQNGCPRGTAIDGNNRQQKAYPKCEHAVLCRADECNDGKACAAVCTDGTRLTLSVSSTGVVSIMKDGKLVKDGSTSGYFKGRNAYCIMRTWVPVWEAIQTTPAGLLPSSVHCRGCISRLQLSGAVNPMSHSTTS